jgi:steroid delta-isomerase-like uncharacterized protein
MTQATPESVARRYFDEIWNRGDHRAIENLVAPNVIGHVNGTTLHGRETLKERLAALHALYATPRFAIEEILTDRTRVLVRWSFRGTHAGPYRGLAPSGRTIAVTGMNLFRIDDNQIAELWVNADDLGELEQLGGTVKGQ